MYETGVGTVAATGQIVGNVRVVHAVHSPELGNTRDIHVYLPPSYRTSGRHYPVVYMHDGQNLFDAATSFAGEWRVDETMESLGPAGVEAIVVAIPNMGGARSDEYGPWHDPRVGGGRGDAYLSFIVHTLKPKIDHRFRTSVDRNDTGIMGSSMGGLISLFGFLRYPRVFGFAGVMSPSLWFAGGAMAEYVRHHVPQWQGRLYLDTGTAEGRNQLRQARELMRLLRRRVNRPKEHFRYVEDRGAGHHEAAWAARFERAIRFLLPKKKGELNW